MDGRAILSGVLGTSNGTPAEPNVTSFTLTPRTIRFGHDSEVFPLKNVARVGKYRILDARFPTNLIFLLVLTGTAMMLSMQLPLILLGALCLAGALLGTVTRLMPRKFAFGVETSSGARRYLVSVDEHFIDRVLVVVTSYFEREQTGGIHFNFENRSINVA